MKHRVLVWLMVILLCNLPTWTPAVGADPVERKITPCIIITGADSHVRQRRYLRIMSLNDWAKLWMEHKGETRLPQYDWYNDPLTVPWVDFDNYMVIAVFQGDEVNNAGLSVVSMAEDARQITFRFQHKHYQTLVSTQSSEKDHNKAITAFLNAASKARVKVNVFGFFIVPRSSKQVRFEENVQGYIGEPPEWQERAILPPAE